jgi:hypothetical protein
MIASFLTSFVLDSLPGKFIGRALTFGIPIVGLLVLIFFRGRTSHKNKQLREQLEAMREKRRINRDTTAYTRENPDAVVELLTGRGYEKLLSSRR